MKLNKRQGIVALFIIGFLLLFYFNRHHEITKVMESYGSTGVLAAIIIMTLLCLTLIPTEGLLLVYFNVYGVVWGTLYAWAGYMISVLIIFVFARYFGTRFIRKLVSQNRFDMVNQWVENKSILGVFIVRILPIPAFIVNCILGTLPSIRFLTYFFTALIAILPYYITSSCLYLGLTGANYMSLLIGVPLLIFMWLLTLKFKKSLPSQR